MRAFEHVLTSYELVLWQFVDFELDNLFLLMPKVPTMPLIGQWRLKSMVICIANHKMIATRRNIIITHLCALLNSWLWPDTRFALSFTLYYTSCAVNRSSSSKLFLLQNFMNIDETTLKTFFWFLRLSAGPQKLEHKVDHNYFTV